MNVTKALTDDRARIKCAIQASRFASSSYFRSDTSQQRERRSVVRQVSKIRPPPIGKSDQPFRSDKENSDNESSRPRDQVCNGRIPLRSVSSSGAKGNSGAGITARTRQFEQPDHEHVVGPAMAARRI